MGCWGRMRRMWGWWLGGRSRSGGGRLGRESGRGEGVEGLMMGLGRADRFHKSSFILTCCFATLSANAVTSYLSQDEALNHPSKICSRIPALRLPTELQACQ